MSNLNEIELKLEKAKAYKTLLTHKFFKKETDVTKLVQAEILKFVENQLASIFGLGESKVSLDKEDVQILKLVAGKLLSKTQEPEEQEEIEETEEPSHEEQSFEVVQEQPEEPKPKSTTKKAVAKQAVKTVAKTAVKTKPVFSPIAPWHSKVDLSQVGSKVDFSKAGQAIDILEGQKGATVIIDRDRSKFAIYLDEIDENTGKYREKILKHAIQQQYMSVAELPAQGVSSLATPGSDVNVPMAGLQAIVESHVTK